MTTRSTYTFALLEVSAAAYDEIKAKLTEAGYAHSLNDRDALQPIDMHGIGLVRAGRQRVADIKAQLEKNDSAVIDRNGTEFLIMEDEEPTGWYAWRTPADEGSKADKAFDTQVDHGLLRVPDYTALAEEIAAWMAIAEVR
jgi:hypothetical protein